MRRALILVALVWLAASPLKAADAVELEFWRSVQESGARADYQAYLQRYPNGDFAALAQNRLGGGTAAPRDERAFLSRADRRKAQSALTRGGYDTRGVDGVFGRGTRGAIRSWQSAEGYAATGFLTPAQYAVLVGGGPVRATPRRGEAAAWAEARDQDTALAYESYLTRYPSGRHAAKARKRLLRRERVAERQSREQALGLNRRQREEIEGRLSFAGFYPGAIDGRFTRDTRKAVRSFRRTRALAEHGFLDRPMLRQLVNETGGGGVRRQGEDYSDAAVGFAAGALLLGGIIILAD